MIKILAKTLLVASVVTSVFLFTGCSSNNTDVESDMGFDNAPDWVNEGTKVADNKKGKLIHGIGSAPKMGDLSLQKSTADNRARAEIARIMSTFMDATISDYNASNGEQFDMSVQQSIKSSTQIALNGAHIIANWRDKKSGEIFSFAELDLKKLQSSIANAETMNASFKKYFNDEFNMNFDRFLKEQ